MTDAEIQLADHEARLKAIEENARMMMGKLDSILATVTELRMRAAIAHTPEGCPHREELARVLRQVEELRETRWLALGGSRVILWLIGGGALALGALIGRLMR